MEQNKYNVFRVKLETLINECSMESGSDTPDFMLAEYLTRQLELWDVWVTRRENWYGRSVSERANLHQLGPANAFEAPAIGKVIPSDGLR